MNEHARNTDIPEHRLDHTREWLVNIFSTNLRKKTDSSFNLFAEHKTIIHRLWGNINVISNDKIQIFSNPSVNRVIHGWLFMNSFMGSIEESEANRESIYEFIKLWIDQCLYVSSKSENYGKIYHDEATAQRLNISMRIHMIYQEHGHRDAVRSLEMMMDHTAEVLEGENFYAGNNNHGMFQAQALRDYAIYANWKSAEFRLKLISISLERLSEYFRSCFTSEGVHVEHSPSYHLMVARHVHEHLEFMDILTSSRPENLLRILAKAELHAIHCIQPDGRFLPLSDTSQTPLTNAQMNVFTSREFSYAASGGKTGQVPPDRTLIETKSGYLFHRSAWGDPNAAYMSFIAAYNGGYHKHSDDLHLYLWKSGYELLTESGPYGYQMKEPYVRYGFSQYGHNNIIVDSNSLPRHDEKMDQVSMSEIIKYSSGSTIVSARNARFDNVIHIRKIEYNDSLSSIEVTDSLKSDTEHEYQMIWNLDPRLNVRIHEDFVVGHIEGRPLVKLEFRGLESLKIKLHRGVKGIRPRGWRFPNFGSKVIGNQVAVYFSGSTLDVFTSIHVYEMNFPNENELVPTVVALARNKEDHLQNVDVRSDMVQQKHEVPSDFASLKFIEGTLLVQPLESSSRATIKLYRGSTLFSERSGAISNMRWSDLVSGSYRARIYPKGKDSWRPPYTSEWIKIP